MLSCGGTWRGEEQEGLQSCWGAVGLWPWRAGHSWGPRLHVGLPTVAPVADHCAACPQAHGGCPRGLQRSCSGRKPLQASTRLCPLVVPALPGWRGCKLRCSTWPPDAPALLSSAQTVGLQGLRHDRSMQRSKRYHVSERGKAGSDRTTRHTTSIVSSK